MRHFAMWGDSHVVGRYEYVARCRERPKGTCLAQEPFGTVSRRRRYLYEPAPIASLARRGIVKRPLSRNAMTPRPRAEGR